MTVTEQREKIIIGLAKVETEVKNLCILVKAQNGNVKENKTEITKQGKSISRIVGIGIGVAFVLSVAIGAVKFL